MEEHIQTMMLRLGLNVNVAVGKNTAERMHIV